MHTDKRWQLADWRARHVVHSPFPCRRAPAWSVLAAYHLLQHRPSVNKAVDNQACPRHTILCLLPVTDPPKTQLIFSSLINHLWLAIIIIFQS